MTAPGCHRCLSRRALQAEDGACYDARACERRRVRRVVEEVIHNAQTLAVKATDWPLFHLLADISDEVTRRIVTPRRDRGARGVG